MTQNSSYLTFLKLKGKSLGELNPGSDEVALQAGEALEAIRLLEESGLPIFGGDILSNDSSGELIYAYKLWGSEFHYLNWYCEKLDNESKLEYSNRSYEIARNSIKQAIEISQKLNKECLVVLVI